MEDSQIIDLYWDRSEEAVTQTAIKYGKYCHCIAYRILADRQDADESVNDTYLAAWNSMPPHRPGSLSAFLGKITRRLSISRWRKQSAEKRGGGEIMLALEELGDCVPSGENVGNAVEQRELIRTIDRFLSGLSEQERDVFVCRYWFLAPVGEISRKFHMGESKVKMMLLRTRNKLSAYLQKEGYC